MFCNAKVNGGGVAIGTYFLTNNLTKSLLLGGLVWWLTPQIMPACNDPAAGLGYYDTSMRVGTAGMEAVRSPRETFAIS